MKSCVINYYKICYDKYLYDYPLHTTPVCGSFVRAKGRPVDSAATPFGRSRTPAPHQTGKGTRGAPAQAVVSRRISTAFALERTFARGRGRTSVMQISSSSAGTRTATAIRSGRAGPCASMTTIAAPAGCGIRGAGAVGWRLLDTSIN